MSYSEEEIQRSKARWESAQAERRAAYNRVMTAFAYFVAGLGSAPAEDDLARLKVCVAVEDEAAHNYAALLESALRV